MGKQEGEDRVSVRRDQRENEKKGTGYKERRKLKGRWVNRHLETVGDVAKCPSPSEVLSTKGIERFGLLVTPHPTASLYYMLSWTRCRQVGAGVKLRPGLPVSPLFIYHQPSPTTEKPILPGSRLWITPSDGSFLSSWRRGRGTTPELLQELLAGLSPSSELQQMGALVLEDQRVLTTPTFRQQTRHNMVLPQETRQCSPGPAFTACRGQQITSARKMRVSSHQASSKASFPKDRLGNLKIKILKF